MEFVMVFGLFGMKMDVKKKKELLEMVLSLVNGHFGMKKEM